jgi:pimeloyl-ACP methyl ester carboxylesterase
MVVLVHAIGLDLTYWRPQIDALAPYYYDVLAYDLRGRGHSSAPATGYDFARRSCVADHSNRKGRCTRHRFVSRRDNWAVPRVLHA